MIITAVAVAEGLQDYSAALTSCAVAAAACPQCSVD